MAKKDVIGLMKKNPIRPGCAINLRDVNPELREQFSAICRLRGKDMTKVLKAFMRTYIKIGKDLVKLDKRSGRPRHDTRAEQPSMDQIAEAYMDEHERNGR